MVNKEENNLKDKIKCPECKAVIPITETLQHQLTESVRIEYEQKKAELDADISEREKEIAAREKEVQNKELGIEERVQKSLATEIEKQKSLLAKAAREEAEASLAVVMQELRDEIKSSKEKLEEA
jgi:hypothetical protein